MNDHDAVQLILQDLDQPLDSRQRSGLDDYLASSERTRQFAELVRKIENSARESRSVDQSGSMGPGLSEIARMRLQRELLRVLATQKPLDSGGLGPDRLVAESEAEYSTEASDNGEDIP